MMATSVELPSSLDDAISHGGCSEGVHKTFGVATVTHPHTTLGLLQVHTQEKVEPENRANL